MQQQTMQPVPLTNAALVAHTGDLDLVIRHVLAGLGHGMHAGRERGAGVEFSEYRAYAPGDEWRRVDWKLLARADRYYVREAERDSHVAVWLWLDASASMAEASHDINGIDKLWFARAMLGCLAAIAQRQGDAFGLVVCGGGKVEFTPAARGPRQLQRILAQLSRTQAGGALPDAQTLKPHLQMARSPALVFAVGDFLEWPSSLSEALLRLRRLRHDVRLLALHTQAELDASFKAGSNYRDPELSAAVPMESRAGVATGLAGVQPHAGQVHSLNNAGRAVYQKQLSEHFAAMARNCRQNDIVSHEACIEQPLGAALRAWLRLAGARARC